LQQAPLNRLNGVAASLARPIAAAALLLTLSMTQAHTKPAQPLSSSASPAWSTVQKLVLSFQTLPSNANSSSISTQPAAFAAKPSADKLSTAKNSAAKLSAALRSDSLPMAGTLIDFKQIAMRSVGEAEWQALSQVQKQDLTATIETLVQNRYYPRWKKVFGKGDVTYLSQSRRNGDTFVSTNLRLGHKDDLIVWQLTSSPPKVVSLAVNKNDLLTKLAQRIQAHQAKGGYASMVAWLKSKSKCDIAGSDMTAAKIGDVTSLKTSSKTIDSID
jgi:ABC-type transporter MlaC component